MSVTSSFKVDFSNIVNIKIKQTNEMQIMQINDKVKEQEILEQYYANANLYLLKCNGPSSVRQNTKCKLYLCNIKQGNSYVRKFIPCYKKSDSVVGLYDMVTNSFYTNKGTGKFLKGKDISIDVGNKNASNQYELPLKLQTTTGEKQVTITLDSPLRKEDDQADYIDLKNKKVVRYDSEESETIEINDLPDIKEIISIEVLTDIQPSKIEICE